MNRISFLVAILCCLALSGCEVEVNGSGDELPLQPQSGEWDIMTTGWDNDDCNADEGLTTPTSVLFDDVEETSFFMTFFENGVQVGSRSTCSHDSDDLYNCDGFTNGFTYDDIDATISMSGLATMDMTSETTVSGSGDFVLECSGDDCNQAATFTNSGIFPCGTTMNFTAEAE